MLNKLLGAATIAAVAFAIAPASAAKMGGCSGANLEKTETMIEAMAEGDGKIMAQKEVALAQTAMLGAPEQGDARGLGLGLVDGLRREVNPPPGRLCAAQSALLAECSTKVLRARVRAGLRNTRPSSHKPRSCSIAAAPRNWRCRAPNPCRAASRSSQGSWRSTPAHRAGCATGRGGRCRQNRQHI